MSAGRDVELARRSDNIVRYEAVVSVPSGRYASGRGCGNVLDNLCSLIVNLNGECERSIVAKRVESRSQQCVDCDGPLRGVEVIEIVLSGFSR